MRDGTSPPEPEQFPSDDRPSSIPDGFRSGVITAITVVLGFSFLFLRSWGFELPGDWTPSGAIAAILLLLSIILQLVSLWRSLQLKDQRASEYRRTLRWYLSAIIVLLVSLVVAALSYSQLL